MLYLCDLTIEMNKDPETALPYDIALKPTVSAASPVPLRQSTTLGSWSEFSCFLARVAALLFSLESYAA